jgi:hypothetical protein
VPSHFNVSTPLDAGFAYTAAAGGAAIVATTLAFARASTRPNPAVPPSMRLAIRVGVATFVVALLIGAVMIAMGVRETRTVSQTAAYTVATALKSGHAATMHGILVLPLLAWAASFAPWPETRRLRIVAVACAGYALGAAVVVVASFLGAVGGTGAGVVAWFIVGTGALCLLVAVAAVLAGLATPSAEPGLEHRGSAAHRTAAAGWMTPRSDRRREE